MKSKNVKSKTESHQKIKTSEDLYSRYIKIENFNIPKDDILRGSLSLTKEDLRKAILLRGEQEDKLNNKSLIRQLLHAEESLKILAIREFMSSNNIDDIHHYDFVKDIKDILNINYRMVDLEICLRDINNTVAKYKKPFYRYTRKLNEASKYIWIVFGNFLKLILLIIILQQAFTNFEVVVISFLIFTYLALTTFTSKFRATFMEHSLLEYNRQNKLLEMLNEPKNMDEFNIVRKEEKFVQIVINKTLINMVFASLFFLVTGVNLIINLL